MKIHFNKIVRESTNSENNAKELHMLIIDRDVRISKMQEMPSGYARLCVRMLNNCQAFGRKSYVAEKSEYT